MLAFLERFVEHPPPEHIEDTSSNHGSDCESDCSCDTCVSVSHFSLFLHLIELCHNSEKTAPYKAPLLLQLLPLLPLSPLLKMPAS